MTIPVIIGVNEDVIQIHNNKDVEFLNNDLVDISLKACWCVHQTKRHHLVLEVAISSLECSVPLVPFVDSHLIVGTDVVELGELFGSS